LVCLLRRLHWECGAPPLDDLATMVTDAVILLCEPIGIMPSEARGARDAILLDLLRLAASSGERRRNRVQLLELVERATTIAMPARAARATLVANPVPVPGERRSLLDPVESFATSRFTIFREAVTAPLGNELIRHGIAWLHGASGTGKTSLALEVAQIANSAVVFTRPSRMRRD
jgi:hypothetical protein